MSDDAFRIAELLLEGFTCGHILAKLALEAQGRDDPDLVRAMSGLAVGMGQGFNCGCLTGGCCVLGLYGGRSEENERPHPDFDVMIERYSGWLAGVMTDKFGGTDCKDVINFDPALKQQRCPGLILESWEKIKEILAEHEIDLAAPPPAAGREG